MNWRHIQLARADEDDGRQPRHVSVERHRRRVELFRFSPFGADAATDARTHERMKSSVIYNVGFTEIATERIVSDPTSMWRLASSVSLSYGTEFSCYSSYSRSVYFTY